jgi:endonuclease G
MAPNLAIASRFGKEAQAETYVMSNVVPQKPDLNQGPWRLLEETVATKTAPAAGEVWVVTGPIYDNQPQHLKAGNEIPDAFFKVIADETPSGLRLQAFILPQSAPRKADYRAYMTSVDEVERQSGFDLFTELPDDVEGVLEAESARYWLE